MTAEQSADRSGAERSAGAEQNAAASRWAHLPLRASLVGVALVWLFGCVWSFAEQTKFAESKHFQTPELLPLVIDGLAVSVAAVAWAASLDGRSAVGARIVTAVAIAGSATSNAVFAWERSSGDTSTVVLAAAIPLAANLAFEVLLAESRRQVLRARGVPVPVKVPYPPLKRMGLAPWSTFRDWRRLVLEVTDLRAAFDAARAASQSAPPRRTARTKPAEAAAPAPAGKQSTPAMQPDLEPVNNRSASAPQNGGAPVRRLHAVGAEHSPTALADAETLRQKWGEELPERGAHALVQREMRWGGEKATKAIRAYRAGRQSGRPQRSADDDKERELVVAR